MHDNDNYFSFLDARAARRRLRKQFTRPRWLLVNIIAFVVTMTGIWWYGGVWQLWYNAQNLRIPVLVGAVWSAGLALMALIQYRRSAGRQERREEIIESEMRGLIEQHPESADHRALFNIHQQFEAELEGEGQWFIALTTFAVINALSWVISALVSLESSWPFTLMLPSAILIISAVKIFLMWQQQNRDPDHTPNWFSRLPLRHAAIYLVGIPALGLASMFRMVNHWDADNLIILWSLALLIQTGWNLVLPVILRRMDGKKRSESDEKPKHAERLTLSDDGELVEYASDEAGYGDVAVDETVWLSSRASSSEATN